MDTTKRLTETEIRETVAAMPMPPTHRAALLAQALAGNPGAGFVVFGAWRRLQESGSTLPRA